MNSALFSQPDLLNKKIVAKYRSTFGSLGYSYGSDSSYPGNEKKSLLQTVFINGLKILSKNFKIAIEVVKMHYKN